MLTKDTIAQKRDILLEYLNRHGAISQGSSVKDIASVRAIMGLEEKDFVDICEHLYEARWIKFLRSAGTWKSGGKIGALWLTPQGLERLPNVSTVTDSITPTPRPKVFISYVRENIKDVTQLVEALKAHEVDVWFDKTHLKPGDRWTNVIRREIAQGDFFIACFSTEYSKRTRSYMNEEITQAVEQLRQRAVDKPWFIPVLLSDCEIPDRSIGAGETLRSFHWVDLYNDWNEGIKRILQVVQPEPEDELLDGHQQRAYSEENIVDLIPSSITSVLNNRKRERLAEKFSLVQDNYRTHEYSRQDVDKLTHTQRERLFAADPEMAAWWSGCSPLR